MTYNYFKDIIFGHSELLPVDLPLIMVVGAKLATLLNKYQIRGIFLSNCQYIQSNVYLLTEADVPFHIKSRFIGFGQLCYM